MERAKTPADPEQPTGETNLENELWQTDSGERKKGVKELVVQLLADERPLPVKQVFLRLNTGSNPPSYQAVHKAISAMHAQGVLARSAMGYELNPKWLKSLSEFANAASSPAEPKPGRDVQLIL
ncbi:hypothetical protein HY995_05170 [Candidatus Micrarchaeota archaeon]|nr:hypothetical protein [Candidatus Micrarchaeota archaeon]